jgi:dTDP-glucose 4,6-dehydratase
MAKILITGVMGTLGRPLKRELEARGHDVWGLDLQHQAHQKYHRADIASFRQLERAFEQEYDFVYHLAAEFGRINGEEYYETLWTTNVIGTRNLLEIQKRKPFKLIFASSSEIYGDKHKDILSEDIPLNHSIIQHNDYAVTKWVNEIQIMNFEKRFGNPVVRLRFFNAYGPGEYYHNYRSVVCLFAYRALHRLPYEVYLGYHRVFMYIDDFIPTLANVAGNFVPGEVYNIGGDEFRSVKDMSDLILSYLGMDDSIVNYLPEDKHNVMNKRPDIHKARVAFGHEPKITLEQGIPVTIDWMRAVYAETIKTPNISARH